MPVVPFIPAIVGAAGVGATIYGANKSSKATGNAADAAQQSVAANNALQSQIYGQNTANLSPFMQRGNAAGDNINALLGLPTASSSAPAAAGGQPGAYSPIANVAGALTGGGGGGLTDSQVQQLFQDRPDVMAEYQRASSTADRNSPAFLQKGLDSPENFARYWYGNLGGSQAWQPAQQQGAQPTGVTPQTAQSAFDQYQNSTGHQFRLQTGSNAIASNKATSGLLKSGSALKALTQYGQDLGTQDFQGYLGNLQGQQQIGLSGANALAGVGTGYANATGANNDSAASATGNAALVGAGQTNALLGQLAGAAGNYLGSSYGGASTPIGYSKAQQAQDRIPF